MPTPLTNDQEFLTSAFLTDPEKMTIDYTCNLFHLYRGRNAVKCIPLEQVLKTRQYVPIRYPTSAADSAILQNLKRNNTPDTQAVPCDGETYETELSRRSGVLTDTTFLSTPCVLHMYCNNNIDKMIRTLGFDPPESSVQDYIWYYIYSLKGHAGHPFVYFLFLLLGLLGVFAFLTVVFTILACISRHSLLFNAAKYCGWVALFIFCLETSISLYINRKRTGTRPKSTQLYKTMAHSQI